VSDTYETNERHGELYFAMEHVDEKTGLDFRGEKVFAVRF
jgi:hypothetical protein